MSYACTNACCALAEVVYERRNARYNLDTADQIVWWTRYGCDCESWKRDWLVEQLDYDLIFTEAPELSKSTAMTHSGNPDTIPYCESTNAGWSCKQNSTVNPLRSALSDEVQSYGQESGATLLFFGQHFNSQQCEYGYGENVFGLARVLK